MKPFRLWIYKMLTGWMPESRFYGFKATLLRWAGVKVGRNVRIFSSVSIMGAGRMEIGDDVFIGPRTILSASGNAVLKIGNHVNIGAMCYITTGTHLIDIDGERSAGEGFNRDIVIENGAWLTVHILVLPGLMTPKLVVGAKAMIMGGSVVMSSVPPRTMMQGNPAKKKGEF